MSAPQGGRLLPVLLLAAAAAAMDALVMRRHRAEGNVTTKARCAR